MNRQEMVKRLLNSYESYFDIVPCEDNAIGLVARCDFHVHNEKYVLVKSARLWEADCHEYVYVFSVDNLTEEVFGKCESFVCEDGFSRVVPKSGHMYTYITAVFVCDDFTKDAVRRLKKSKHYKSYKFTLHGWADFRTFAIRASDKALYHNPAGTECSKFAKKL